MRTAVAHVLEKHAHFDTKKLDAFGNRLHREFTTVWPVVLFFLVALALHL